MTYCCVLIALHKVVVSGSPFLNDGDFLENGIVQLVRVNYGNMHEMPVRFIIIFLTEAIPLCSNKSIGILPSKTQLCINSMI
jgi:hypothetical protein